MAAENSSAFSGSETTSQTERVVLELREKLLRGEFRPGERLAELTLVPMLNASRTPVRLALERLSHQGLLEALPYGGFRVREFTVSEIWDAIEIRGVLEGTAARLAAERLRDPAELAPLRRCHEAVQVTGPADMSHFVAYVENNLAYHRELWKLARSSMLERTLEGVCILPFAEPGALVFGLTADAEAFHTRNIHIASEHHRAIIEAIENREGTRAESLAREHSRLARSNLDWVLRNHRPLHALPGGSLIAVPQQEAPAIRSAKPSGAM
jgi:GntR family transcriptional regulator of vanillate catabolism